MFGFDCDSNSHHVSGDALHSRLHLFAGSCGHDPDAHHLGFGEEGNRMFLTTSFFRQNCFLVGNQMVRGIYGASSGLERRKSGQAQPDWQEGEGSEIPLSWPDFFWFDLDSR